MTSKDQSTEFGRRIRLLWVVVGWALVILVVYLSVTPAPPRLPGEHSDKFSHVFAYFVLMSWFANLHDARSQRTAYALGFIALGVGLEFVQRWTGYRSFDLADMAAGAAGVAAGWLLAPPRLPNYLRLAEKIMVARARG